MSEIDYKTPESSSFEVDRPKISTSNDENRPQISINDIHSKHLSNHELDTINKIIVKDNDNDNDDDNKTFINLTLNNIIENTIKFIIDSDNQFNEIYYSLKLKRNLDRNDEIEETNNFKLYIYSLKVGKIPHNTPLLY